MKYYLASKALRAFSATEATKRAYRKIGNLTCGYSREHYEARILSQVQYINMVQTSEWRGGNCSVMRASTSSR